MAQTRQSLRDRIDASLLSLGTLTAEGEMRARAEEICEAYPEDLLLDGLASHLDNENSQLRGGLGLLAQLLPRAKTEQALLRVVLNKRLSATARLSAVTILQDFLDRPVQSQFIADIADTDAVVLASMQEALAARDRFPGVLIEYTQQFAQLDPDHRTYVLGLLSRVSPADAAELLRFMAYHRTGEVAEAALKRLAEMTEEEAALALYILSQTLYLDPDRMQKARALVRRKRFSGENPFAPLPIPEGAHAMPLGFSPQGGLMLQLTIPTASQHLLLEYDCHAGIRNMQQLAMEPRSSKFSRQGQKVGENGTWSIVVAADPDGSRFAFFLWHLSFTLSLGTGDDSDRQYPAGFQILAPHLWRWQPAELPPNLRSLFETEADLSVTSPHDLANKFIRHELIQELPEIARAWFHQHVDGNLSDVTSGDLGGSPVNTADPMYKYFTWWSQTTAAIHLQSGDSAGSQYLAQAATLFATKPQDAATFCQEICHLLNTDNNLPET